MREGRARLHRRIGRPNQWLGSTALPRHRQGVPGQSARRGRGSLATGRCSPEPAVARSPDLPAQTLSPCPRDLESHRSAPRADAETTTPLLGARSIQAHQDVSLRTPALHPPASCSARTAPSARSQEQGRFSFSRGLDRRSPTSQMVARLPMRRSRASGALSSFRTAFIPSANACTRLRALAGHPVARWDLRMPVGSSLVSSSATTRHRLPRRRRGRGWSSPAQPL